MVTWNLRQVSGCSLAVLLLACSVEAARKLPYPAASNAKDIPTLDQVGSFPVGTDLTSTPQHFLTPSDCFPAGAQIQTPTGPQPIESLRHGDQVLTVQPSGKAAFEEVFMFSHQDGQKVSMYATLTTSSGKSISATPGHYLWAQKPGQEPQLTRAGDIKVGDDLFELEGSQAVARTVVVAARGPMQGVFNPHTASGSLVVDGFAATVLTDFIPASLALHTALTMPAQALYHILPTPVVEAINTAVLTGVAHLNSHGLHAFVTTIKA